MPALKSSLLLPILILACSALPGGEVGDPPPGEQPPPVGAGFPDLPRWGRVLATVQDAEQGETRTVMRSPEGEVWAKVHHPPDQIEIITRIDVRRRLPDGEWRYESWDPARQAAIRLDPEPCHLCHSMAPAEGTWTAAPK